MICQVQILKIKPCNMLIVKIIYIITKQYYDTLVFPVLAINPFNLGQCLNRAKLHLRNIHKTLLTIKFVKLPQPFKLKLLICLNGNNEAVIYQINEESIIFNIG